MIITIVMEQYGALNNGTTATAMRLGYELMKKGHTIRVLTCSNYEGEKGEYVYQLNPYNVPIFNGIILKQGMQFASYDEEVCEEAIKGSDIVHIYLPFNIGIKVKKLCKKYNVPFTSAFHCQPENITSTIGLGKFHFINRLIYFGFRKLFYKDVNIIHCPSEMIKTQLVKHHYKNDFRVISNGITSFFSVEKVNRPEELKNKIVLVSAGRYSKEKRQDIMIDAVLKSKYSSNIVLILCGKGPKEKYLLNKAKKLNNQVIFKFCTQEELKEIFNYSDLYLHASDAEIEGLACMEAMACGLVPIISDSKLSATSQFALSKKCIIKKGSSTSLAESIDYFIEHPQELRELKPLYAENAKKYRIEHCIDEMEKMFNDAINLNKKK